MSKNSSEENKALEEFEKILKDRAKGRDIVSELMEDAKRLRKEKQRKYLRAAAFISLGLLLLFLSLPVLLERITLSPLNYTETFVLLTLAGALSFGYGFYKMGVS